MVIDLPFEGRKVEGSRKYRRRERVPKAGSRREETIIEPINSCIGEFRTIWVNDACRVEPWPSHWRWNTGGQFIRAVIKSNSGRKGIEKPPCGEEKEGQESRSRRVANQADSL